MSDPMKIGQPEHPLGTDPTRLGRPERPLAGDPQKLGRPENPLTGNPQKIGRPQRPLTADQLLALKRLHQASQQLEGVFLQMVMSAMQDTVPKESIFGQESASESTWQEMLTNQRAQAIADQGSFGVAKVLEQQLRSQVLGNASHESQVQVERGNDL